MDSSCRRNDPHPLTAEEEAIKLNTDCVYFLASPLTCKKGSDCEYRHSEGARLNPRDCRFWLSGNCLNPKCLFRHPPLDGMVASPKPASAQIITPSQVPQVSLSVLPMSNSFTYNLTRNSVPCYYYLKGSCLKGDKCPFMHRPPIVCNSIAKQTTSEKEALKINECGNQQNLLTASNIGKASADKLINAEPSAGNGNKAAANANSLLANKSISSQITYETVRSSTGYSLSQNIHFQPDGRLLRDMGNGDIFDEPDEVGYTELERPLNLELQSPTDHYQNGQAADEIFRDSSPGFDVLVDHVVDDADYFHETDGFEIGSSQGRRNMIIRDDYDSHHSDYESSIRLDQFHYDGADEFRHYDRWDKLGTSYVSDRILNKPLSAERRLAKRLRSPDEIDASDLRHRLRKQRKRDSYFSATDSARCCDPHSEHDKNANDKYLPRNSYRNHHVHESSISNRLRGRITFPKPLSSEILSDFRDRRERGRQRVRLSPVRQSGNHGSFRKRLIRKPIEDSFANERCFVRRQKTRNALNPLHSAGPRSLAELKGPIDGGSSREHQYSEASVEFEGPKPLSFLLKRKRELESEIDSSNRTKVVECEIGLQSQDDANEASVEEIKAIGNLEECRVETVEEGQNPTDNEQIIYKQHSFEDGTEGNYAAEDEVLDYTDQRDGEYDYDTMEGGDFKTEDVMNRLDADEDEDDFTKKIGLIFS